MIPFERQLEPQSCGAASLVMVYRSFGVAAEQQVVLDETERSRQAFQLAVHARKTGFQAVIVRFCEAWEGLCALQKHYSDCRTVLNHRLGNNLCYGHYSVVVDLKPEQNEIILHDPLLGPNRLWPRETLESLWNEPGGEIQGRTAILIRREEATPSLTKCCEKCETTVEMAAFREIMPWCERIFCPRCDQAILA